MQGLVSPSFVRRFETQLNNLSSDKRIKAMGYLASLEVAKRENNAVRYMFLFDLFVSEIPAVGSAVLAFLES